MSHDDAVKVIDRLQDRLVALIDLQLTLKHIHWNVVGPELHRRPRDARPAGRRRAPWSTTTAERIAALGGAPNGLPGNLVSPHVGRLRLGRAMTLAHLGALDLVYDGIIGSHRELIDELEDLDQVTQDMVIEQSRAAGAVPVVRAGPPGE